MNNLAILNQWLILNANGDWERTYGFNIRSTSDPGWQIDIDLIKSGIQVMRWYGF